MGLVIGLGVLALLVVVAGIFLLRGEQGDAVDQRLDQLGEFTSEFAPEEGSAGDDAQRRSLRDAIASQADRVVANRGFTAGMKAQLRKANLKLTVGEYLMLHLVTFAVGGLVGLVLWRGNVVMALLAAIAGLFFPRIYVASQRNRRLKKFNNQLSDILNLWVNALRAGHSVLQAMEAVAREAPSPASDEFRRIVMEVQIGLSLEVALDNMLERIESEDLDLVFTAVKVQREVGGNLAEILDTISDTIRQRVRIKGEIATLTAQGRITGWVISMLPVILTLFLSVINPTYMNQLFVGPPWLISNVIPCGWPILACGAILIAAGAAIISRIVDIEV